jgi:hypothetical protein
MYVHDITYIISIYNCVLKTVFSRQNKIKKQTHEYRIRILKQLLFTFCIPEHENEY